MLLKQKLLILLFFIFLLPLILWLFWLFTPRKNLVAVIVDKTVELPAAEQHSSFTWVLNNERFAKNRTSLYNNRRDYFGFFPLENEKFRIKGLERFSGEMLEKLSNDADMVYFADTYGVYKNDWYKKNNTEGSNVLYGGMSEQDIQLLQDMKAKHKLIISEFNTIGSPTSDIVRGSFENLFALKWSGWTGRYFASLDTAENSDLPKWIITNYRNNHNQWPFHNAGIVFINTNGQVVILEKGNELISALPVISVNEMNRKKYNIPAETTYPFWFDIMQYDSKTNTAVAEFKIDLKENGKQLLSENHIPDHFPAILTHQNTDYRFYYFSGNFCDNPVAMRASYFKGIGFFKSIFYNSDNVTDPHQFFWDFYRPLMSGITNDYYRSLRETKRS